MEPSPSCSALEDLAAFAEGRLRGAERERVINHLAGCADCREVLAESMQTADELAAEDDEAPVVTLRPVAGGRSSRFGWPARAAALAAAAVVAVGAVVIWQADVRRNPPDRGEWLAAMPPPTDLALHTWGGVVLRGGDGELADQARSATELGALLVDVDVALAAGDGERAQDFLHRIATVCDDAGLMDDCVTQLRAIAESGDAATTKVRLAGYLPQLERELHERFDGFFLDLGTFLNEAQLAARTDRADFLDSPPARRYLDWVLSQGHERLPDALVSRLELGRNEDVRSYREQQADVAELLAPVRDRLLVLRDSQAPPAARAEAARQALDALTR